MRAANNMCHDDLRGHDRTQTREYHTQLISLPGGIKSYMSRPLESLVM